MNESSELRSIPGSFIISNYDQLRQRDTRPFKQRVGQSMRDVATKFPE